MTAGPLYGLKFVEMAGIGPAPFAAMMLADLGATGVRIESPVQRLTFPGPEFDITRRGRSSMHLNLREPVDLATARDLIDAADLLIEGYRPGVMERLGLGPQATLGRNPKLVFGRITGWGQDGPYALRAGHDLDFIAVAGILAHVGRRGHGEDLQWMSNQATDRIGKNRYGSNQNSAFYAISCLDAPATPGRTGLAAAAKAWSKNAPVPEMARAMSWGNAPCSFWFDHLGGKPAAATSTTTAPIVVVGTRFDPATPYSWAIALHEQLPTSSLITYEGDGHTAYGGGSACVDRAIDEFLLTGNAPASGKTCN